MIELPEVLKSAVSALGKLPGVGEKTALRMVMSMANWKSEDLEKFANSALNLRSLHNCRECGMYADEEVCTICTHATRKDSRIVCVVEQITDLLAIEKSGQFKGRYVVLGGVLNPLLGIGPAQLRFEHLTRLVNQNAASEVILALNPSVEGDATCAYIKSIMPDAVKVDRIGFGIPIGGSLEYLDPMTITKALENRKTF